MQAASRGSILLLSTSDTDLLAARASGADYRLANPARLAPADLGPLLETADVVVVRLLGGEQAWREGLAALRAGGRPLIVLGGEAVPDAALMALSTVPAGIAIRFRCSAVLCSGWARKPSVLPTLST